MPIKKPEAYKVFVDGIKNPPTDLIVTRERETQAFETSDVAMSAFARSQSVRLGKGGELPFEHEAEPIRPKEKGTLSALSDKVNQAIFHKSPTKKHRAEDHHQEISHMPKGKKGKRKGH